MTTIRGYDYDGVISHGVKPFGERSFIITGRSYEQAARTYRQLEDKGIDCAVYFHPSPQKDINWRRAAEWKCDMIELLDIDIFYEDSIVQIEIIKARFPNLDIRHVVDGIAP